MDDIDILARTIYGEARGEGPGGMIAVACTIVNRAAIGPSHPHFGDGSISSACMAHEQFSCWNENDPNCDLIRNVTPEDKIFNLAMQIAISAVHGGLHDITNGATYYYARGTPEPPWAIGKTPCAIIGHHIFFSNIQ